MSRSGFISPPYPIMGASPDGIVKCKCCNDGLLEIKCPYSCWNKTIQDEQMTLSLAPETKWSLQIQECSVGSQFLRATAATYLALRPCPQENDRNGCQNHSCSNLCSPQRSNFGPRLASCHSKWLYWLPSHPAHLSEEYEYLVKCGVWTYIRIFD